MNTIPLNIILLLAVGAVVLCAASIYLFWKQYLVASNVKIRERMGTLEAAGADVKVNDAKLSLSRQHISSPLDKLLLALPGGHRLDSFLAQAGVSYGPAGALLRVIGGGIVGFGIGLLLSAKLGALAVPVSVLGGMLYSIMRFRRLRRKRLDRLVKQLPEAMDFFARSMRAGNPFIGALKSAPKEIAQPIARELEITFEEMNYGLDFEEVMQNLAKRVDAEEVRFFVTAVLVQKTTGGNLAEIMNRISTLMRERIKTRGEVMVQAAEMKASGRVLFALPFFIAGVLQLLNPEYFLVLLENSSGRIIVMVQLVLMIIGYMVMNRMVNFRI
jgi:tight adherence protein B